MTREQQLEAALRDMLKWFEKYPEFRPNPERMDEVVATIKQAQRVLEPTKAKHLHHDHRRA